MSRPEEWRVPPELQPDPRAFAFDVERALDAVVSLRAAVPEDAFTAETLGTERAGQGVVIRAPDLVLTIGYLVTEAEEVWLTTNRGRTVPAHVLAYDFVTGFGLVQALSALDAPALALGESRKLGRGDQVVVGGAGGRARSLEGRVVARQEFAGYWEYLIDDAIFTAPAHPHWGGTALIGPKGDLLGIGSLQLQHQAAGGRLVPINMSVPIDLLKPNLDDMLTHGAVRRPARPWLGVFVGEDDGSVTVIGFAGQGPGKRAGLRAGDVIRAVAGVPVDSVAAFYRALWSLGEAGIDVPLTLEREGDAFEVAITSADRAALLRRSRFH